MLPGRLTTSVELTYISTGRRESGEIPQENMSSGEQVCYACSLRARVSVIIDIRFTDYNQDRKDYRNEVQDRGKQSKSGGPPN